MNATDPAVQVATTGAPNEVQCLQIGFPKQQMWTTLVRDLKLSPIQANALGITIQHVVADLDDYNTAKGKTPPRATLVGRLELMEKAFRNLRFEMERSAHLMSDFLPHDLLMNVGESLTFSAMNEALGEDVSPKDSVIAIRREVSGNDRVTITSLENHYASYRHALGLKKGHLLLKHIIDTAHASLNKWVEADKLNKGGCPPNMARRYLVYRLAEMAPEIIGRRASIAKTGPFVRLCSQVVPACGLSATGIESAVPLIVREMRTKTRRNF
jgi:hypothetical protein